MDSNQRFAQLKQKYRPVFEFISRQPLQIQNLDVQNDKLVIRGVAPSEGLEGRILQQIERIDPSFSDVTPDIRIEAKDNAPNTGETQVQTSQDFSHPESRTR